MQPSKTVGNGHSETSQWQTNQQITSIGNQFQQMNLNQKNERKEKPPLFFGAVFDVDESMYKLQRGIGQGAYGTVCEARNVRTGQKVAIKKISKACSSVTHAKRTLRELIILRKMSHDNILKIIDIVKPKSYEEFEDVYVVTECLDTDLHQIITSPQALSDDHIQFFLYQLLRGLKYIHSARVLHRDLKPSNLLLNSNCDLRICDFGLARVAIPEQNNPGFLTEYVATRWYRAPEIMLSWKEYTKAVDVWATGCIFAELLGRKPLFPGQDYMNQLHLVIAILGTPSYQDTEYIASAKAKEYVRRLPFQEKRSFRRMLPNANPLALDLLEKMLAFAPEKRITVEQALAHPYLAALHDPEDEPISEEPFNFDFENPLFTTEQLKDLIWNEVCHYHPDMQSRLVGVPRLDPLHMPPSVIPDDNNVDLQIDQQKVIVTSKHDDSPKDIAFTPGSNFGDRMNSPGMDSS